MSDSYTRYVRLNPIADRTRADNGGTRCERTGELRAVLVSHRMLFNRHQRRLSQIVREYRRPGVAVFAIHRVEGMAGHLWLEASEALRAGVIGRHSCVDLFLEGDEGLSLRHLLVLVRQVAGSLWLRVVDLATPAGFQAEEGGVLRAVEANGVLVLAAASFSFFVVPTGGGAVWDRDAEDPWSTLPRRVCEASPREVPPRAPRRKVHAGEGTSVSFLEGLEEPGPLPALLPGERVEGHLWLADGHGEVLLPVGARPLERGLILGRYSRCNGATATMTNEVSRVHAVVMAIDGQLHLMDAGSTNGIFLDDEQVKCAPITPGATYSLATLDVRWEPAR